MANPKVNIEINAKNNASKELNKAKDDVSSFSKVGSVALGGIATAAVAAGVAVAAMAVATGAALVSIGKAAVTEAARFEQTTVAFTTMLGSAEQAQSLLNELTAFAAKTPFTLPGVEDSARQLLAMGIETDKLLPTLKSLGDVSAGLGIELDRVAYNFGQVKAQGVLTGVELKDFARAGIPIISELAKNLNVTEAEIKDMVSAGVVGFADVEKAFTTMTSEGGKFENLMEMQSLTMNGIISNLQDKLTVTLREIGNALLPVIKDVLGFIMPIIESMSAYIVAEIPKVINEFVNWASYLWLEFLPVFQEAWATAREEFARVYETIKPNLDVLISTLQKMLEQILKTDVKGITPFIRILGDLAVTYLPLVIDWITFLVQAFGTLIAIAIETRNTVFSVIEIFTDLVASASSVTTSISGGMVAAFQSLTNSVRDAWTWVNNLIQSLFSLSGASSAISGAGAAARAVSRSANGNVFDNGQIMAYANGGIVNSPTLFPMANGMGLMGEAGPEAILPLERASNGKLGVRGGGGLTIQITGNNFYGDDKEFAERVGDTIIKELKSNLAIQGF